MRLARLALLLVTIAPVALADEGAWGSHLGGGVAWRSDASASPRLLGAVVLESTYGITDRWNYEGTLTLDFAGGQGGVLLGSASEYVLYRSNHLRWNAGLGLSLRLASAPVPEAQGGVLAETALRWTVSWGFGVGASLQATWLWDLKTGGSRGLWVYPALATFMEL